MSNYLKDLKARPLRAVDCNEVANMLREKLACIYPNDHFCQAAIVLNSLYSRLRPTRRIVIYMVITEMDPFVYLGLLDNATINCDREVRREFPKRESLDNNDMNAGPKACGGDIFGLRPY